MVGHVEILDSCTFRQTNDAAKASVAPTSASFDFFGSVLGVGNQNVGPLDEFDNARFVGAFGFMVGKENQATGGSIKSIS